MNNKFDFNRLFKHGVNYQRLSDKALIRSKIEAQAKWKVAFPQSYAPWRQTTKLGSTSSEKFEDILRKV